uniref:Putative tail protein n=1 Tax=viral metagenome TaxID=1070528 RepID=A0A6H1Z9D0_9ZZZZ
MGSILKDFCGQIGATPADELPSIRYPGGKWEVPMQMGKSPGLCALTDEISSALAIMLPQLGPLLTLMDAASAVFECLQKLPTKLDEVSKINDFLSCMAALIPKLSDAAVTIASSYISIVAIPPMVLDVIAAIEKVVTCLINQLKDLNTMLKMATGAIAAPENPRQKILAQCQKANIEQQSANLGQAIGTVMTVLCNIKKMMKTVPALEPLADKLPPSSDGSSDPTSTTESLDSFIAFAETMRDALKAFSVSFPTSFSAKADLYVAANTGVITNGGITWEALADGTAGNSIRIKQSILGLGTPLSVTVAGNDITINLATAGGLPLTPTSTAAQLIAAVNANAEAALLVQGTADGDGGGLGGKTQDNAFKSLSGGLTIGVSASTAGGGAGAFKCS